MGVNFPSYSIKKAIAVQLELWGRLGEVGTLITVTSESGTSKTSLWPLTSQFSQSHWSPSKCMYRPRYRLGRGCRRYFQNGSIFACVEDTRDCVGLGVAKSTFLYREQPWSDSVTLSDLSQHETILLYFRMNTCNCELKLTWYVIFPHIRLSEYFSFPDM